MKFPLISSLPSIQEASTYAKGHKKLSAVVILAVALIAYVARKYGMPCVPAQIRKLVTPYTADQKANIQATEADKYAAAAKKYLVEGNPAQAKDSAAAARKHADSAKTIATAAEKTSDDSAAISTRARASADRAKNAAEAAEKSVADADREAASKAEK